MISEVMQCFISFPHTSMEDRFLRTSSNNLITLLSFSFQVNYCLNLCFQRGNITRIRERFFFQELKQELKEFLMNLGNGMINVPHAKEIKVRFALFHSLFQMRC